MTHPPDLCLGLHLASAKFMPWRLFFSYPALSHIVPALHDPAGILVGGGFLQGEESEVLESVETLLEKQATCLILHVRFGDDL